MKYVVIIWLVITTVCHSQNNCNYYVDLPDIGVVKIEYKNSLDSLKVNFSGYPSLLKLKKCKGDIKIYIYEDVNYSKLLAKGKFKISDISQYIEEVYFNFETNKEEVKKYNAYPGKLHGRWVFNKFGW